MFPLKFQEALRAFLRILNAQLWHARIILRDLFSIPSVSWIMILVLLRLTDLYVLQKTQSDIVWNVVLNLQLSWRMSHKKENYSLLEKSKKNEIIHRIWFIDLIRIISCDEIYFQIYECCHDSRFRIFLKSFSVKYNREISHWYFKTYLIHCWVF